jgi:hypothetical protein
VGLFFQARTPYRSDLLEHGGQLFDNIEMLCCNVVFFIKVVPEIVKLRPLVPADFDTGMRRKSSR